MEGLAWRLKQLTDAVEMLGKDAEDQIAWIGDAHPDELGLAFHDGFMLVAGLERDGVEFSTKAKDLLAEIDATLEAMSGGEHAELWTTQGVRSRPEWDRIRALAQNASPLMPSL